MNLTNKQSTIVVVIVLSFVLLFVGYILVRDRDIRFCGDKRFEQEAIPANVEIINGIVDSPAVKIQIDSSDEFVAKIVELGADVIYKSSSDFTYAYYYVFTDDYQIAYFFRPSFDTITGEIVN